MGLHVETSYARALHLGARTGYAPAVVRSRRPAPLNFASWLEKECRTGGLLSQYLTAEKATMDAQIRSAARAKWQRQQALQLHTTRKPGQNPIELRQVAEVPSRLYHRWRQHDRHFWEDPSNLRRLARDNDDLRFLFQP